MAVDGRMRRRSPRIREGTARAVKPRGGIRSRLESSCSSGKSGDRGIPKRAGASETVDHIVKPGSAHAVEEPWIYVRGCRIDRSGLRLHFDSQGDVYVPDSEEEEEALEVPANGPAGVDLAPTVAADGAAAVDLALAVAADGGVDVDLAPAVAMDGATDVDLNGEVAARLAKKVLGEDLHPEVAGRLAKVLSKMEPLYHECFIDMYKVVLVIRSF